MITMETSIASSSVKMAHMGYTRIPRHMIRGNNLFLFDPLCQIFSPDQMAKTSPSALLFFKNISALPFRPENTRVAYQVSYSPNG
jgi:hypothetical protein